MAGILVVGDTNEGRLAGTALQLATAGAELAKQMGEPLNGALIGADLSKAANEFQCAFSSLHLVEREEFRSYTVQGYIAAAEALIKKTAPNVVLFAHGANTRDWVPGLAARINAALVLDCIRLAVDSDALIVTKPVNGGGICAEFSLHGEPRMATVRTSAYAPHARGAAVAPTSIDVVPVEDPRVSVLSNEAHAAAVGLRLKDAKIVVAGGRGIGGPEHWHFIEETSAVLGAAIGCSRPVADAGWVPSSHQVGLSGTSVAPDLYIAVGISGAPQHLAGISAARTVVAINNSPDAEIFTRADYGVADDYREVLPAFIDRVKQLRAMVDSK